jgi:alpha-L-arabinofuranosidase
VDATKPGAKVPSSLYGIFLEEINNAGEGGLYAELIQNRGFEDANLPPSCTLVDGFAVPPRTDHFWEHHPVDFKLPWRLESDHPAWSLAPNGSNATIAVVKNKPLTPASPHALKLDLRSGRASVENTGFWGIGVRKGEAYDLSLFAQTDGTYRGPFTAALLGSDGKVLAEKRFAAVPKGGWKKLSAKLVANASDPKARFALRFEGQGSVWLDFVSLFPAKTFKNRPNGLRPDIAQMIADLKPAFIRFPGGCYVEGLTIETRPRWEQTLGPLEARTPTYSPWGYWNSNGFGYHEWLQFCEDVGADGLYVFNAGISCAFRSGTFLPEAELPTLIQNTLDAIEYAVGPTSSKWGALRAKNGHPKPFPLKYVEIGNEQSGPEYGRRVGMFARAIKAKYPQIKVALSSWIAGIDQPAIDAAGKLDIVDEHAYTGAHWALANFDHFAKYARDVPWELYIGEFATNAGVGRGNMLATLNDAAYMMSMEKNADLVKMGSYAPLLENANRRQWEVNLIHFDSARSFGRASYYACRLFAENRPDVNLATTVDYRSSSPSWISGPIGLGTYGTSAEFKDIQVDGKPLPDDGWKTRREGWVHRDGVYAQTTEDWDSWTYLGDDFHDATLTLKARKIKGAEGFVVSIGNAEGRRVQANFGGWGNRQHGLEASGPLKRVRGEIEAGRWYDVKVVSKGREVWMYLDGEEVLHETLPRVDVVRSIAGKDARTGETIVKILNPGSETADLTVDLAGLPSGPVRGTATSLASPSLTAENSFADPKRIIPKTEAVSLPSTRFQRQFPPYSLTILRLKPGSPK